MGLHAFSAFLRPHVYRYSYHQKTGEEGPVVDCLADSMIISIMFGCSLRVRGETKEDNVKRFLQRAVPRSLISTIHQLRLTFDRGYGKFKFVRLVCNFGLNMSKIANVMGFRFPFYTADEYAKLLDGIQKMTTQQQQSAALNLVDLAAWTRKKINFSL